MGITTIPLSVSCNYIIVNLKFGMQTYWSFIAYVIVTPVIKLFWTHFGPILVLGEKFASLSDVVSYFYKNPNELKEKNGDWIRLKYPINFAEPTEVRHNQTIFYNLNL